MQADMYDRAPVVASAPDTRSVATRRPSVAAARSRVARGDTALALVVGIGLTIWQPRRQPYAGWLIGAADG